MIENGRLAGIITAYDFLSLSGAITEKQLASLNSLAGANSEIYQRTLSGD